MIAEIYNKISQGGSSLNDRLEDQLTGNFFGAIRYLPFYKGLKPVLARTSFFAGEKNDFLQAMKSIDDYNVVFWKRSNWGEIDIIIETENTVIGIEVKYLSGISSDDDVDLSKTINQQTDKLSVNQLSRYSQYFSSMFPDKKKYLFLLAPFETGFPMANYTFGRNIIHKQVAFGFLSWQDIYNSIEEMIKTLDYNKYENVILNDIIQLLTKKGFDSFKGFNNKTKIESTYYKFENIETNFRFCKSNIKEDYYEFKW